MTIMEAAFYDRICRALTDYETGEIAEEESLLEFYGLLCEVTTRMENGGL